MNRFTTAWLRPCALVALGGLLSAASVLAQAQAARVIYAQGEASVQRAGKFEPLAAGNEIPEGALLQTGDNGYLYLKLADDGFFVLRPKTQARIAAYKPVPSKPAESEFRLELIQGVARAITGKVAEQAKDRFRLNTPVAAIGVKGTDFVVSATADATYVSVNSGGVIASPFAADCSREALGACRSQAATTLLASTDRLLEIRAGSPRIQTLDLRANPDLRRLAPDQGTPPAAGESNLRSLRSEATQLPAANLALVENPSTAANVLKNTVLPSPAVVEAPIVVPVQPVTPVIPVTPVAESSQKVFWGRWAEVANMPKGVDLAEFMKGLEPMGISWPSYVIARSKDAMEMPLTGAATFNLKSYEVGIFLGTSGNSAIGAQVLNPSLTVDFGARQFATQISVTGGGYSGDFIAKGNVLPNGTFEANSAKSNMSLAGGLAGSPADQAGYIFQGRIATDVTAAGGTFWRKAP